MTGSIFMSRNDMSEKNIIKWMNTARDASIMTLSAKTTRRSCMRDVIDSKNINDRFIKSHTGFEKKEDSLVEK